MYLQGSLPSIGETEASSTVSMEFPSTYLLNVAGLSLYLEQSLLSLSEEELPDEDVEDEEEEKDI